MPRPTGTPTRSYAPRQPRVRAFTMAELLVVIGIILLLVGILIPTVGRVRKAGQATDTKALISAIDGACQVYYQDHGKWPGPLAAGQLGVGIAAGVDVRASGEFAGSGAALEDVTGTENLVLGLLGGLAVDGGEIVYDPSLVGNGAVKLGNTPGGYRAYYDARAENLSMQNGQAGKHGSFADDSGAATDSLIPEFVDRFSSPMPLLYLRAQSTGFSTAFSPSLVATADGQPASTGESRPVFAFSEIAGYVLPDGDSYIGVGKDPDFDVSGIVPHGLQLVGSLDSATLEELRSSKDKGSTNYTYPMDLRAALVSPTAAEARQKDRYVIISAGVDRIYGTRDDLTNFGEY